MRGARALSSRFSRRASQSAGSRSEAPASKARTSTAGSTSNRAPTNQPSRTTRSKAICSASCSTAVTRPSVRNNRIANRSDLWLNDRGNGIHVWNNTGSLIEGNTVTSGRDGIYIEISHDNVLRANRFEGLRFAVHYMYANRNEVTDNISIRNHVGFALMYSKELKVLRNISVADLEHGLMLHTMYKSEVAQNYIYGTGEKCLFIYTSANNDIHDNRLEQCGIGVHFTVS